MRNSTASHRNRFDRHEWGGAFGDLGTLIPFLLAYVSILKMDANGLLVSLGAALVVVGVVFRTPFPVQPMKAIGAVAISQIAISSGLTASTVIAGGLVTGVLWLAMGLTRVADRIGRWIPRSALLGIVLGLGFSFMLEGLRMMTASPWIAGGLLVLTMLMLSRPGVPAMLLLLAVGVVVSLIERPTLADELSVVQLGFKLPTFAWSALTAHDIWAGLILLALPQLPLTFGNAYLSITEENNRLFPDRPVTHRVVALSTGLMNIGTSIVGGIPLCHGAGGMAGHVQFGARTGGSSIILGAILLVVGLCLSPWVATILNVFPQSALGVILFLAGLQLALGSRDTGSDKADRFVVLATAAIAVVHVGLAMLFGIAAHYASRRGWLRL